MDNNQARYKIALAAAEQLTGSRESAEIWLGRYVRALDARPVDLLESDGGLEVVLTVIGRLEHGIVT